MHGGSATIVADHGINRINKIKRVNAQRHQVQPQNKERAHANRLFARICLHIAEQIRLYHHPSPKSVDNFLWKGMSSVESLRGYTLLFWLFLPVSLAQEIRGSGKKEWSRRGDKLPC